MAMYSASLRFDKQRGISLVGLMVGMLLSMMGILAGVMLYQNLVRISVESRTDAAHDGQLASALLALQLEVQSAGYGIPGADDAHIQQVDDADGTRVYWRYRDTSGYVCRGFDVANVSGTVNLRMLEATCNSGDNLTSLSWTVQSNLASFPRNPPTVTLSLTAVDCFPYGLGETSEHYQLTVNAAAAGDRSYATNSYSYCLPNVSP